MQDDIPRISFGLYFRYLTAVLKLFLQHPSSIAMLGSRTRMAKAIDDLAIKGFNAERFAVKHVSYDFDIFLNPDDIVASSHIGIMGWHEIWTTELFIGLLNGAHSVIDIGANVGWFTLVAARKLGKDGVIASFEPEPTNFSLLAKSVAYNHFSNVKLFQECISDVDGRQLLHLSVTQDTGAHSIVRDFGGPTFAVRSSRLDTIMSSLSLDQIDILKLDVEGAEPLVLSGARNLLEKQKINHIIMEWNPEAWSEQTELLEVICDKYQMYEIEPFSFLSSLPTRPLAKKLSKNSLPKMLTNVYFRRSTNSDLFVEAS